MKLKKYIQESRGELKKVVWPKKSEVAYYIRVVLVMTLISAIILGLMDFLSLKGIFLLFPNKNTESFNALLNLASVLK